MLISSAVALALVATMGVHEASAQKGKEKRNPGNPLRVKLQVTNVTTGEVGRNVTASGGDEISIRLRVENRTGDDQIGVVSINGGIPGCMFIQDINEYFLSGEKKEETVGGLVPEGESGLFTVDVSVLMTKTNDVAADNASVAYGGLLKGDAPQHAGLLQRIFARMVVRSLLQLDDDGTTDAASVNMSQLKQLYR